MSIDLATHPGDDHPASSAAMSRVVRVCVLGAGEQSTEHLVPALLRLPHARITVLADPVTARRDALADRLGVPERLTHCQRGCRERSGRLYCGRLPAAGPRADR
jgi:hypothetical protein